ncbi:DUF1992 domain-containing protein [Candidatus Poribacteria bacterium]|nr:DUF1992 domain-containing protein [Candidatus Poribacteria bacterium]
MPINVNKQIEEAMERGEFANLPGEGKPIKLDTNPFLTPQARMANRLLKENGFAPRWVELEKEIKREEVQLERILINLKGRRERLAAIVEQYPQQERARVIAQYSEKLENLNQKIQRVNLLMPTRNRQYALINRAEALDHFQKACPSL